MPRMPSIISLCPTPSFSEIVHRLGKEGGNIRFELTSPRTALEYKVLTLIPKSDKQFRKVVVKLSASVQVAEDLAVLCVRVFERLEGVFALLE